MLDRLAVSDMKLIIGCRGINAEGTVNHGIVEGVNRTLQVFHDLCIRIQRFRSDRHIVACIAKARDCAAIVHRDAHIDRLIGVHSHGLLAGINFIGVVIRPLAGFVAELTVSDILCRGYDCQRNRSITVASQRNDPLMLFFHTGDREHGPGDTFKLGNHVLLGGTLLLHGGRICRKDIAGIIPGGTMAVVYQRIHGELVVITAGFNQAVCLG